MILYADTFPCPMADIVTAVDEGGVVKHLYFVTDASRARAVGFIRRGVDEVTWEGRRCEDLRAQVDEFFQGSRTNFDLPFKADGTPFQMEVWRALLDIPFGETASYGEVAASIGRPKSSRAVGRANGTNPISLLIPCHRVIGAGGELTGYGGGIAVKRSLLDFEQGQRLTTRP